MGKNRNLSEQAWEELCERCGVCCFEKIENENGTIFFTGTPCRYLDLESRLCRIYDNRFLINPECVKLTREMIHTIPWLHEDCAYMKALKVKASPRLSKL